MEIGNDCAGPNPCTSCGGMYAAHETMSKINGHVGIVFARHPPPPSPPPPPAPPPGGGGVIIALGAGGGGVALLLVLLIVIVVCRKGKKPAVPPPAQPNMMPQAQSQIEMGTISTSVMSASPAATAVPVAQAAVPVQTADPFPPTSNNLAFAPRFDVNTGQPIPKFDPNTGQQNWA